jgi:hypothetical protein
MIRKVLFASLIALGAATGAAQAQAPDPSGRVPTTGNIVGGGAATIAGGGDNMQITYAAGGAGGGLVPLAQPPRLARARNSTGGGSMGVDYLEPETARPGREAWLVGGGNDAEVVYRNPR